MRALHSVLLLLALTTGSLSAQNATTALSALQMLPRDEAQRLARIEAREGGPTPSRWYLLVHDPQAENGLREYVIAGGEVETSRTLSQFAESLRPEDILGVENVRIDSDRAAAIAEQYARSNNVFAATLNYDLKKSALDHSAQWTVTCLDLKGRKLGKVVVSASAGTVLSHEGFALDPLTAGQPKPESKTEPIASERAESNREERRRERERVRATQKPPVARVATPPRTTPVPNPPGKFGSGWQRLFGGPQPPNR